MATDPAIPDNGCEPLPVPNPSLRCLRTCGPARTTGSFLPRTEGPDAPCTGLLDVDRCAAASTSRLPASRPSALSSSASDGSATTMSAAALSTPTSACAPRGEAAAWLCPGSTRTSSSLPLPPPKADAPLGTGLSLPPNCRLGKKRGTPAGASGEASDSPDHHRDDACRGVTREGSAAGSSTVGSTFLLLQRAGLELLPGIALLYCSL